MEERYRGGRGEANRGRFTISYKDLETNFQGRWALNVISADVKGMNEAIPGSAGDPEIIIKNYLRLTRRIVK